jgi:hypothetical protein
MSLAVLGYAFKLAISVGAVAFIARKLRRADAASEPANEMLEVHPVRLAQLMSDDLVRVSGIATSCVTPGRTMVGDRPYLAYRLELIIDPGLDQKIVVFEDCQPFYLEDGAERALVQPPVPVVALVDRAHDRCTAATLPTAMRVWLEDATASDRWETSPHLRWIERWVEPGEPVTIVGAATLKLEETAGGDYRQSAEVWTFETADDAPLSVSNDPRLREPPATS